MGFCALDGEGVGGQFTIFNRHIYRVPKANAFIKGR